MSNEETAEPPYKIVRIRTRDYWRLRALGANSHEKLIDLIGRLAREAEEKARRRAEQHAQEEDTDGA